MSRPLLSPGIALTILLAACHSLSQCQPAVGAENWPRFRGPNGTGISTQKGFPTVWSTGDYDWEIELPGIGHSSPIVWGDRLFVASAGDEGTVRHLFCIDAETGEILWSRQTGLNASHNKHLKNSWASSTPATDGERVYVCFADQENYTVTAWDFEGNVEWRRNLGPYEAQHGHGVSPMLFEDLLIVPNDQMGPSSIVALDAQTGQTVWSVLRELARPSYATPMILEVAGRSQLICSSNAMGVTGHDPHTGQMLWRSGSFPVKTVASPVFAGGLIIQSCGRRGRGEFLIGVDPTGSGNVSETHIRYRRERNLPYVPTPIVYDGHLFLWGDEGVVTCIELETFEDVWTERVGGNFSGSPVCIDGKLYCFSEAGEVCVLDASPHYHLHGKTPLGDASHATPAVANGRLYLRTFRGLACLKAESP